MKVSSCLIICACIFPLSACLSVNSASTSASDDVPITSKAWSSWKCNNHFNFDVRYDNNGETMQFRMHGVSNDHTLYRQPAQEGITYADSSINLFAKGSTALLMRTGTDKVIADNCQAQR